MLPVDMRSTVVTMIILTVQLYSSVNYSVNRMRRLGKDTTVIFDVFTDNRGCTGVAMVCSGVCLSIRPQVASAGTNIRT